MTTGRPLDRREFLTAAGAGTLIVAVGAQGCTRVDEDLRGVERKPTLTITPLAHVRLDDTGTVTVVCHRSEMGQGIRTTMAMVIADELEADWERVVVEQAPGDEKIYGSQNTDGSTSIRDFLPKYRETGATVRLLLEAAAAHFTRVVWRAAIGRDCRCRLSRNRNRLLSSRSHSALFCLKYLCM